MFVNGMKVSYFIYGLEKAREYFQGECTFSYVTVPHIRFERILINEIYCLIIDREDVVSISATEGESDKLILLAEDVALESHTIEFVTREGYRTESLAVSDVLKALKDYRNSEEKIQLRLHEASGRMDFYVGRKLITLHS
ncbi:MAG: hypothetical protein E7496_05760 [Ruminococcus sp.]|nr:hypothetical protein [Ruminococcus sp.]